MPAGARLTTRLRGECGAGIAGGFSCVSAAAVHYGIDWRVVCAAFIAHVDPTLDEPPQVTVLGIDEARRGKPKWVQDPDTHEWQFSAERWHTGIADADGTGGLLWHVEGRTAALGHRVAASPAAGVAGPGQSRHVTIDLSASYARAVADALPDAVLVADLRSWTLATVEQQRAARDHMGQPGPCRSTASASTPATSAPMTVSSAVPTASAAAAK